MATWLSTNHFQVYFYWDPYAWPREKNRRHSAAGAAHEHVLCGAIPLTTSIKYNSGALNSRFFPKCKDKLNRNKTHQNRLALSFHNHPWLGWNKSSIAHVRFENILALHALSLFCCYMHLFSPPVVFDIPNNLNHCKLPPSVDKLTWTGLLVIRWQSWTVATNKVS